MNKHVTFCSPGAPNITRSGSQAELDAVQLLQDNLEDRVVGNYCILVNYNMPLRGRGAIGSLEIDLLVINRFGLFVLEVKDWRGIIEAYDDAWILNNRYKRGNAFISIEDKARVLHSWLKEHKLKDLGPVSVMGLVVLAHGTKNFVNKSKHDLDGVVISLDARSLTEAVNSPCSHGSRCKELTDKDILQIKDVLYSEHEKTQVLIGNYRVVGELSPGDLFEAFEAVNVTIETQRVRIKRYLLEDISSKSKRSVEDFQHSARAVSRMGDHKHILRTTDFFPETDRPDVFYEVTEFVRGNRLDEIIAQCDGPISLEKQLDYVEPLCKALIHAHKHDVYHRNLNPETVFVTEDGIVKLADFDFAKILGAQHTVRQLVKDFANTAMTAPELFQNPSAASPASDIYSLGSLWYFLANLPEKNLELTSEKVDTLQLPKAARELMRKMLTKVVMKRPQNVEYVLDQLRTLRKK